jgi:hypothetical protein
VDEIQVCSVGAMILTGGNRSVQKKKKIVPSPLLTTNPICIGLESNGAFRRVEFDTAYLYFVLCN